MATIEFAIIAPTTSLPMLCHVRNVQMALTHKVLDQADPNYALFYKNASRSSYVILDNSLWELGSSLEVGDLYRACEIIEPDELIIPDVFRDAEGTKWAFRNFRDAHMQNFRDRFPKLKFNVVIQGSNLTEWLDCYDYIATQPLIDTVSLPKVLDKDFGIGGRISMLNILETTNRVKSKEYHLLGIWDNPIELLTVATRHPWVRSVDSALPVHAALAEVKFDLINGYIKQPGINRPEGYFELPFTRMLEHLRSTIWNIRAVDMWCNGGTE